MDLVAERISPSLGIKVLPPLIDPRLSVNIREEKRFRRITEPARLPERIFQQAEDIGNQLLKAADQLPDFLCDPVNRARIGISDVVFKQQIEPFLEFDQPLVFFGADGIIDRNGDIKILEINPRPQALGIYDEICSGLLHDDDPNARISTYLLPLLNTILQGGNGLVISHPRNAFFNYHKLLGKQLGIPIAPLQDLQVGPDGTITHQGKPIKCLFRQCSMVPFLDPEITNTGVVAAIRDKRAALANGPLAPILGDKALLPLLPELEADISQYLPKMRIVTPQDEIELANYKDWWLKGETRGSSEMTLQLSKRYRSGWTGQVIKALLKGDFQGAEDILMTKDNNTARWLLRYVRDFKETEPGCFLLQENIPLKEIVVSDENGETWNLRTMLRMYFVPDVDPGKKPHVFLEMKAGPTSRISAAGYNIPVRRSI